MTTLPNFRLSFSLALAFATDVAFTGTGIARIGVSSLHRGGTCSFNILELVHSIINWMREDIKLIFLADGSEGRGKVAIKDFLQIIVI